MFKKFRYQLGVLLVVAALVIIALLPPAFDSIKIAAPLFSGIITSFVLAPVWSRHPWGITIGYALIFLGYTLLAFWAAAIVLAAVAILLGLIITLLNLQPE